MRFGSVCSGIEAASVAWNPLGFKAQWLAENDRFPSLVLDHHYPSVPNVGDITQFVSKVNDYGSIDVLIGGTPCQSFSIAGEGKGLDDDRGKLMLTYLELAAQARPRWVVWENVPNVLSINGGRDFRTFILGLAKLGYGFAYRVLNAQFFGVAQRRRRVFVIGYLGDWRPAGAVLFERYSLSGNIAPGRSTRKNSTGTIESGIGSSGIPEVVGALTDGAHMGSGHNGQDAYTGRIFPAYKTANPLTARMHKGANTTCDEGQTLIPVEGGYFDEAIPIHDKATRYKGSSRGDGAGNGLGIGKTGDAYPTIGASDIHAIAFAQNQRQEVREMDVTGAICADPGATQQSYIAFSCKDYGNDCREDVSPTLRAMNAADGATNGGGQVAVAFAQNMRDEVREMDVVGAIPGKEEGKQMVCVKKPVMQVRRITPREAERLQGFPDDYTFIKTGKGKKLEDDFYEYIRKSYPDMSRDEARMMAADGPRYKALGNSMAVPVVKWLGERILLVNECLEKGNNF